MKQIQLTKKVHIPEEGYVLKSKKDVVPTATNYPGAILSLSDQLADELVAAGSAVPYTPPKAEAEPEAQPDSEHEAQ